MATNLIPPGRPGRRSRKARGYSDEIRRLHNQGYPFEAIREALAAVGIDVSNRTVRREAARSRDQGQPVGQELGCSSNPQADTPPTSNDAGPWSQPIAALAVPGRWRSGREIAEEFVLANPTNPLVRAKDQS
jgi:hypothetical protein